MARFRLLITYNGASYYGWQKQKDEMPTIQSAIELALYRIFQQKLSVIGAGRTDTGTHAIGQNAHFDLKKNLPGGFSVAKALNRWLPKDIRIRKVWRVPAAFHALRSCTSKSYIYCVFKPLSAKCIFKRTSPLVSPSVRFTLFTENEQGYPRSA